MVCLEQQWGQGDPATRRRLTGNSSLAEALDMTRFEVYESYLDEEFVSNRARRVVRRST